MGKTAPYWKILALLAAITVTAVPGTFAGDPGPPGSSSRYPERPTGEPLLLSLRIARVNRDWKGVARWKSVARQRRLVARHPYGGTTRPAHGGHAVTGRHPPSGR